MPYFSHSASCSGIESFFVQSCSSPATSARWTSAPYFSASFTAVAAVPSTWAQRLALR